MRIHLYIQTQQTQRRNFAWNFSVCLCNQMWHFSHRKPAELNGTNSLLRWQRLHTHTHTYTRRQRESDTQAECSAWWVQWGVEWCDRIWQLFEDGCQMFIWTSHMCPAALLLAIVIVDHANTCTHISICALMEMNRLLSGAVP